MTASASKTSTTTTRKRAVAKKTAAPKTVEAKIEEQPIEEKVETKVEETKVVEPTPIVIPDIPKIENADSASITSNTNSKAIQWSDRTVPWMKMGKITEGTKSAKEAALAGGIDFDVEPTDLWYQVNGKTMRLDGRKLIIRKDNEQPLSILSDDYPILQYGEAFDFMDQIDPEYVAAGSLKGGKQGFMVVKAPETFEINILGEDKHELYGVLRTSHDGSRAVEIAVMPLRHRCMNQLTLSSFTSGVQHRWAIRHTTTMREKLEEAKNTLAQLGDYAKAFEILAGRLAEKNVSEGQAYTILSQVEKDRPRKDERIDNIIQLWKTAPTIGFVDNGWGLVNAVSEFYDWHRVGGSSESRFVASLNGDTFKAINKTAGRVLQLQ